MHDVLTTVLLAFSSTEFTDLTLSLHSPRAFLLRVTQQAAGPTPSRMGLDR